jgi:hypothetical protein
VVYLFLSSTFNRLVRRISGSIIAIGPIKWLGILPR